MNEVVFYIDGSKFRIMPDPGGEGRDFIIRYDLKGNSFFNLISDIDRVKEIKKINKDLDVVKNTSLYRRAIEKYEKLKTLL